jgi:hypothetical protein
MLSIEWEYSFALHVFAVRVAQFDVFWFVPQIKNPKD